MKWFGCVAATVMVVVVIVTLFSFAKFKVMPEFAVCPATPSTPPPMLLHCPAALLLPFVAGLLWAAAPCHRMCC